MYPERLVQIAERQSWVDPIGDALQDQVSHLYSMVGSSSRQLKNLLHGTWLGHPAHPALTDVPIGFWTTAVALDAVDAVSESDELAKGASTAVGLGLLGALLAAAAGVTDWQHTGGRARRLGLIHGMLNLAATGLFAASFLARLAGDRTTGRRLGALGLAMTAGAAYLGGTLVFRHQVGVDHTATLEPPEEFTPALAESDLSEGTPTKVIVADTPVVLVRRGTRVYALVETCSHLGGPLSEGSLEGDAIVCPWHGSRFALKDGRPLDGPATFPEPCFETRIREGQIEIRLVRP